MLLIATALAGSTHKTVVPDVHDVVVHCRTVPPTIVPVVAEKFAAPKFMPRIVAVKLAEVAEFV